MNCLLPPGQTYEGMFGHMCMEDLFRCVPKMATLGMLDQTAPQSTKVVERIGNIEAVKEER